MFGWPSSPPIIRVLIRPAPVQSLVLRSQSFPPIDLVTFHQQQHFPVQKLSNNKLTKKIINKMFGPPSFGSAHPPAVLPLQKRRPVPNSSNCTNPSASFSAGTSHGRVCCICERPQALVICRKCGNDLLGRVLRYHQQQLIQRPNATFPFPQALPCTSPSDGTDGLARMSAAPLPKGTAWRSTVGGRPRKMDESSE